jgi:hypothetical protein
LQRFVDMSVHSPSHRVVCNEGISKDDLPDGTILRSVLHFLINYKIGGAGIITHFSKIGQTLSNPSKN